MTPKELISILRKSGNKVLESMADNLAGGIDTSNLESRNVLGIGEDIPLNKKYERLLSCAIVYVLQDGDEFLLSSNPFLIHHLEVRRAVKNKNTAVRYVGRSSQYNRFLKSKNPKIVKTWDLIANKPHIIKMDSRWQILGFKTIVADNAELLVDSVNFIISRGEYVGK